VTVSGARVDVVALDRAAGDCVTNGAEARLEASRPIDGSGRVAVKLWGSRAAGGPCEIWAWARVRVFAQVPIAARSIRAGEVVMSAVRTEEREIKSGHVPAVLTETSIAARAFGAGQMIEAGTVNEDVPRAGQPVKVLIVSGALAIEQMGRAVPCGRENACAVLPSGKHVEGTFAEGRLMVRMP
jgi:flagella basal body P-ring formation protein FlgA